MFGIVATGSGFSGCSFLLCSPTFFTEQKPPFWRAKRGFLVYKSMVFEVQKGGFWCAKVWFLKCKKGVFVFRMRNNHEINELQTNYDDVASKL